MDEETLFKTVFTAQAMGCGATDAEQASFEADSAWDQLQEFRGTAALAVVAWSAAKDETPEP